MCAGILALCKSMKEEFKNKIRSILKQEGGITCDDVKWEGNRSKYYDFVNNYIEYGEGSVTVDGSGSWKFVTKLLLIFIHKGSEIINLIRETLERKLVSVIG